MTKILIGVIVAAVCVIVTFMVIDPKQQPGSLTAVSMSVSAGFSVTIEGQVVKTGSYTLEEGAIMSDLINAAGGVTDYADDLCFFDDAELTSGSTYYIASKYDTSNVCTLEVIEKVNINTDDAETLTKVNGFTSTTANSVVSYRASNGDFKTLEDLMEVYGIGNATYRKVRDYCTLHE